MIKLPKILTAALPMGLVGLLTGCKMVILQPKGIIATDEKHLLITAVLLMLIIVIPVIILVLAIARKYRASNTQAKYMPEWGHSVLLEAIWWAIPLIIIVILATITWISTHQLDPYRPLNVKTKPITIEVVALEWKWLFIYPQQNIATVNFVEFPVHTPINFLITSDAPMNSFQIPQLGGQIYAMNGMQTKLHLMADEVGDYDGRSVSYSGDGFSDMKFIARAASAKAFAQWVKSVQASPNELTMDAYNNLVLPSENNQVEYFSSVTNDLFHKIIMKFMMPMMHNTDKNYVPVHL